MIENLNPNPLCDDSKENPDGLPELRQIGDRLPSDSWHIDAVLPPNAGEMVYEELQPVAATIQGNGKSAEKRHDDGLKIQLLLFGCDCYKPLLFFVVDMAKK